MPGGCSPGHSQALESMKDPPIARGCFPAPSANNFCYGAWSKASGGSVVQKLQAVQGQRPLDPYQIKIVGPKNFEVA
jgi:hypothetical protein